MKSSSLNYITEQMEGAMASVDPFVVKGKVVKVVGTIIEAVVPAAKLGELCILRNPGDENEIPTEVVGFAKDAALLTPLGNMIYRSTIDPTKPEFEGAISQQDYIGILSNEGTHRVREQLFVKPDGPRVWKEKVFRGC